MGTYNKTSRRGRLIIDRLQNPDDFRGEQVLTDRIKLIGQQVIARMLHDHLKCEPLAEKAIPGFDLNTVTFEVIGPVFDSDFGVIYTLKLIECLNLEFNPIGWESFY